MIVRSIAGIVSGGCLALHVSQPSHRIDALAWTMRSHHAGGDDQHRVVMTAQPKIIGLFRYKTGERMSGHPLSLELRW